MDYTDFSEQNIKTNCPHCDTKSHVFEFPLEKITKPNNFYILCDPNPIVEGHTLVIPKAHLSCIGEYGDELMSELYNIDTTMRDFLAKSYGSVAVFEHGIFGQTVFHSHIHYLPFTGSPTDIVPEGTDNLTRLSGLEDLKALYKKDGGYLYMSIGSDMYAVNPNLQAPRFFRDRFAKALGRPDLGNWKAMRENEDLLKQAKATCLATQQKWQEYTTSVNG